MKKPREVPKELTVRNTIPDSELGRRFEDWIIATGQQKQEVAWRLGFSPEYLSRLVNGPNLISFALVGRFCFEYGFGVARDVFGGAKTGGKL